LLFVSEAGRGCAWTEEPRGRAPAYQILADELRDQITSGRLRPGERLPTEPELCARNRVSRSTVREALRLLSSQNLIITTRGVTGGSFVAQPSPAKLAESLSAGVRMLLATQGAGGGELMEIREMIEIPAAGLAAQRRTEADLDRLRATLFDPVPDDPAARCAAHGAFHAALAAASGNPLYELVTSPLYAVGDDTRLGGLVPHSMWVQLDAEHREILRCVAARDVTGAQRATTWHLARLRSTWPRRPRPRTAPDVLGQLGAAKTARAGTGGPALRPDGMPACAERTSAASVAS
jgi:GntR family transcriptional regulator, transcriptional repressor for pyruvate dehydrogenase complex